MKMSNLMKKIRKTSGSSSGVHSLKRPCVVCAAVRKTL